MTRTVSLPVVLGSLVGVMLTVGALLGAANSAQQAAAFRACVADGVQASQCDAVAFGR